MAEDAEAPRDLEVRQALGHLCTGSLVPWWVRDKADVLLRLRCVSDRAAVGDGRLDEVEVLAEILRELVGRIRYQSHGEILWTVLDLDRAHPGTSVEERRRIAGESFRDGEKPVKASTIRQHHEKRALDRLTEMLLAYEKRHVESASARSAT
jgi:hypothetical protein